MALEIRKAQGVGGGIVSDRRLYLTADRSRVVEDGDREAATLFATPGYVIPGEQVAQLGLATVDGKVQQRDLVAEAKAADRAALEAKEQAEKEAAEAEAATKAAAEADAKAKAAAASAAEKSKADPKGKR